MCIVITRRVIKRSSTAILDPPLSPTISAALNASRGITSLYSHQATAVGAVALGKHVVVSTSTASGKSVIYQIPALRFLEATPEATAVFIYPTKVLYFPLLESTLTARRPWPKTKE